MVAAGVLGLMGGRAPNGPLDAQIGISDPCKSQGDRPARAPTRRQGPGREGLLGRVDRTVIKTGLKATSAARWEREQLAGPGMLQKNVGAPSRRGTIKFEFDLDILGSLGQCPECL